MKNLFQILLLVFTLVVFYFTVLAFKNEGSNLLGIFINDIQNQGWNGQFNLDFSAYLTLSAIWIAWRNKFSIGSILFAVVAMVLGIIVFAPYLLYLIWKEKGDYRKILLGLNY